MRVKRRRKKHTGKNSCKKTELLLYRRRKLVFPKIAPDSDYASPRTRTEAGALLLGEIQAHKNFVFASVKGDWKEALDPFLHCAVYIDCPKDIRLARVKNRSFRMFGERMLPGGDLHEQEEKFFAMVQTRTEDVIEKRLQALHCPILRVDGTKAVFQNADCIIKKLQNLLRFT